MGGGGGPENSKPLSAAKVVVKPLRRRGKRRDGSFALSGNRERRTQHSVRSSLFDDVSNGSQVLRY